MADGVQRCVMGYARLNGAGLVRRAMLLVQLVLKYVGALRVGRLEAATLSLRPMYRDKRLPQRATNPSGNFPKKKEDGRLQLTNIRK